MGTVSDQADPPREEREHSAARGRQAELEYTGFLQEEGALLREEERETRQVDLAGVHLGFGKIGVDGGAGKQVRSDAIEDVGPSLVLGLYTVGPCGVAVHSQQAIGLDIQTDALAGSLQPFDVAAA